MKVLLVVYSYHHNNTEKIANVFASVLDAKMKTPQQTSAQELQEYSLVGFGSGIDSGKHYKELLNFVDILPPGSNKKTFVFSTFGAPINLLSRDKEKYEEAITKNHSALKEKLQLKGYMITGEFSCGGFNTNSFLKFFGGINKGRPNADDLKNAEEFALKLKQSL